MRQNESAQCRHLRSAVRNDGQLFYSPRRRVIDASFKRTADPFAKRRLAFSVRAGSFTARIQPCAVCRVVLHLVIRPALEIAEIHLPQVIADNLLCVREENRGGLLCAAERRHDDLIRRIVGCSELRPAPFGKGDIRCALIAMLLVIRRFAVTQKNDQHGNPPLSAVGMPQNISTTMSARAASRHASRPAASRAVR